MVFVFERCMILVPILLLNIVSGPYKGVWCLNTKPNSLDWYLTDTRSRLPFVSYERCGSSEPEVTRSYLS